MEWFLFAQNIRDSFLRQLNSKVCVAHRVFNYCFVTNRTSTVTEQRREEKNMASQKLRKLRYRQDEEVVEEACKEKNVLLLFAEIRNGNCVKT